MNLDMFNPISVLIITWVVTLFLLILFKLTWNKPINAFEQVPDDPNCEYNYIVKMIFGAYNRTLDLAKTTLTIDILNSSQKNITKFQILPDLFVTKSRPILTHSNPRKGQYYIIKFQLNRKTPLDNIDALRLSIGKYSNELLIHSIELQDLNSGLSWQAFIDDYVTHLPSSQRKTGRQTYQVVAVNRNKVNPEDNQPTAKVLYYEWIICYFLGINIIILLLNWVKICSNVICERFVPQFDWIALSGITVAFISIVIVSVLLTIYREIIKKNYSINNGIGCYSRVRIFFLLALIAIGIIIGVAGATIADSKLKNANQTNVIPATTKLNVKPTAVARNGVSKYQLQLNFIEKLNNFKENVVDRSKQLNKRSLGSDQKIRWLIAIAFSIGIFTVFLFPMTIFVGFYLDCLSEVSLEDVPIQMDLPRSTTKISSDQYSRRNDKKHTRQSINEESQITGSRYYEQVSRGSKVKSISQYGLYAQTQPYQKQEIQFSQLFKPKRTTERCTHQTVRNQLKNHHTKSTASTGSQYYHLLVKEGKGNVKSVSQYITKFNK